MTSCVCIGGPGICETTWVCKLSSDAGLCDAPLDAVKSPCACLFVSVYVCVLSCVCVCVCVLSCVCVSLHTGVVASESMVFKSAQLPLKLLFKIQPTHWSHTQPTTGSTHASDVSRAGSHGSAHHGGPGAPATGSVHHAHASQGQHSQHHGHAHGVHSSQHGHGHGHTHTHMTVGQQLAALPSRTGVLVQGDEVRHTHTHTHMQRCATLLLKLCHILASMPCVCDTHTHTHTHSHRVVWSYAVLPHTSLVPVCVYSLLTGRQSSSCVCVCVCVCVCMCVCVCVCVFTVALLSYLQKG